MERRVRAARPAPPRLALPRAWAGAGLYGRGFEPGDTLLLYSDGVTECPKRDEMYGIERLERKLLELARRGLSAADIARDLLEDVRAYSPGGLHTDDVTLVVMRRL